MHKTKLLKLLGISLIVGILGLTGFCKKSKDNNDLALGAGLVVAQQQAEQAAYEAANNTENPEFFCAFVRKIDTYYTAELLPLVKQDCNQYPASILGSSSDEIKQRLLNTINNDPDLNTSCPNTRNAISNFNFSSVGGGGSGGGGAWRTKNIPVTGKSLLSEVGLSTTTYTVVSPNAFKLSMLLQWIDNFAKDTDLNPSNGNQPETTCKNAIENKLNSIDSGKFCSNTTFNLFGLPVCDSSSGKTKVVQALCAYGSGVPSNYRTCATLKDQF